MPLYRNVPTPKNPDWKLVSCAKCGSDCWETDLHRTTIQRENDVTALCTECAIKIGMGGLS